MNHLYEPGVSTLELMARRCTETGDINGALWLTSGPGASYMEFAKTFIPPRLMVNLNRARLRIRKLVRFHSKHAQPSLNPNRYEKNFSAWSAYKWHEGPYRLTRGFKRTPVSYAHVLNGRRTTIKSNSKKRLDVLEHQAILGSAVATLDATPHYRRELHGLDLDSANGVAGKFVVTWARSSREKHVRLFAVGTSTHHKTKHRKHRHRRRTRYGSFYDARFYRWQGKQQWYMKHGFNHDRLLNRAIVDRASTASGQPPRRALGWSVYETGLHLVHVNPNPGCESDMVLVPLVRTNR